MIDVDRAEELPTDERMAWSARPVWNRRTAQSHRRTVDQHLAVAGRRSHLDRHLRRRIHRRTQVAGQPSVVTNFALDGHGRPVRNKGTYQQKGGNGR